MSNKTKLNPDVQKRITDALRLGNTRGVAAIHGGISHRTFDQYMLDGEKANWGQFFQFRQAVKEAEKDAAMGRVAGIMRATIGGEVVGRKTTTFKGKDGEPDRVVVEETYTRPEWTAAAWWLERKSPKEWGRRDRLTVEYEGAVHQQRQAVELLLMAMHRVLTPEQWEELGGLVGAVEAPMVALEEHLGDV